MVEYDTSRIAEQVLLFMTQKLHLPKDVIENDSLFLGNELNMSVLDLLCLIHWTESTFKIQLTKAMFAEDINCFSKLVSYIASQIC